MCCMSSLRSAHVACTGTEIAEISRLRRFLDSRTGRGNREQLVYSLFVLHMHVHGRSVYGHRVHGCSAPGLQCGCLRSTCGQAVVRDYGQVDILVHAVANAPEGEHTSSRDVACPITRNEVYQITAGVEHIQSQLHSHSTCPAVRSPLLDTTRAGYQAAMGASAYSLISLVQRIGPSLQTRRPHT